MLTRLQKDLGLLAEGEVNLLVLTPEKLERLKREDTALLKLPGHEFSNADW
jgi:hypothetical protein